MPVKKSRKTTQRRQPRKSQTSITLDKVLEIIDTYFMNNSSKNLYDILTGLRGPDINDKDFYVYKDATTAVLRMAVCKKSGTNFDGGGFQGVRSYDTLEKVETRKKMRNLIGSSHFVTHAYDAFKALGLKWDVLNDINPSRKGYVIRNV